MTDDERERLGRIAYEACCEDGRPRGFDAPDPCEPWEDLPPESRAHFAREAAAVAAEVRRRDQARIAALLLAARERLAGWYADADSGIPRDIHLLAGGERVKALEAALAALEDAP